MHYTRALSFIGQELVIVLVVAIVVVVVVATSKWKGKDMNERTRIAHSLRNEPTDRFWYSIKYGLSLLLLLQLPQGIDHVRRRRKQKKTRNKIWQQQQQQTICINVKLNESRFFF